MQNHQEASTGWKEERVVAALSLSLPLEYRVVRFPSVICLVRLPFLLILFFPRAFGFPHSSSSSSSSSILPPPLAPSTSTLQSHAIFAILQLLPHPSSSLWLLSKPNLVYCTRLRNCPSTRVFLLSCQHNSPKHAQTLSSFSSHRPSVHLLARRQVCT